MNEALRTLFWPALAGLLAAALILSVPPRDSAVDPPAAHPTATYADAVDAAAPSVVNIYTAKLVTRTPGPLAGERFFREFFPPSVQRQRVERSLGSGVIVSEEGYILTNNHVIADADAIQVLLHDGRSASAVVIGEDPATDLAVLQVQLPQLHAIELGDSNTIRVGDVVLAIGNPLGFGHSVTQGIVSALGRYGLHMNAYEDYIQTDATVHLGNSGGALIDTAGRLLGINTLIYTANARSSRTPTGIGISLAIPVDLAVFVMQDLIDYGEVIRGWLGVSVEPVISQDGPGSRRQTLLVIAVSEDSPAERAGIRAGDIITHIDNEAVQDARMTMHQIARLRPGDRIGITVERDTQTLDLNAIVGTLHQSQS